MLWNSKRTSLWKRELWAGLDYCDFYIMMQVTLKECALVLIYCWAEKSLLLRQLIWHTRKRDKSHICIMFEIPVWFTAVSFPNVFVLSKAITTTIASRAEEDKKPHVIMCSSAWTFPVSQLHAFVSTDTRGLEWYVREDRAACPSGKWSAWKNSYCSRVEVQKLAIKRRAMETSVLQKL